MRPGWVVERVSTFSDLPNQLVSADPTPHTTVHRLRALEGDRRFQVDYLVARLHGEPLLALPTHAPVHPAWPDPDYAPRCEAGHDTRPRRASTENEASQDRVAPRADEVLLVAGRSDFRTTLFPRSGLEPDLLAQACTELLVAAQELASGRQRRPVIKYVEIDSPLAIEGLKLPGAKSCGLGERFVVDVGKTEEMFVASLDRSKRGVVRRDKRDINAEGVRVRVTSWEAVLEWALDAIAEVHLRHHSRTHPALVERRLRTWLDDPQVNTVAFEAVHGSGEKAATLGWYYADTLELYEVAMPGVGASGRHTCYLAAMFHGPFEFMRDNGLRCLDLALEAAHPKRLRGAIPQPLLEISI